MRAGLGMDESGRAYDEVAVGDSFSRSITITDTHLVLGAGLIGDFNPHHVNEEYAKSSRFGTRILHGLITPENRALFRDSPDAAFEQARLTAAERSLVRERDWHGLVRYGASFFTLEKLARVSGVSNPEMVAAMRGEPLDEFLRTRNVPGAR
jgi:acyl dehydratase